MDIIKNILGSIGLVCCGIIALMVILIVAGCLVLFGVLVYYSLMNHIQIGN